MAYYYGPDGSKIPVDDHSSQGEKDKAAWRIAWTPEAILPKLSAGRLVRMTRIGTSRGRIAALTLAMTAEELPRRHREAKQKPRRP